MEPAKPTDPLEWVGAFEKELRLTGGFFVNLLHKEDDWSFIVKLHALVEAAVSHLLATICGDKLLEVFTRLGLRAKLRFTEALGVLDKDERTFVDKLADIRNVFAHDVRQAGATLAAYVAGLDANQLKSLKVAVGPGIDPFPIGDHPPVPELEFVRDNPKLCIWLKALFVISFIYQRKDLVLRNRDLAAERERLLQTVLEVERLRRVAARVLPRA
jgi:hypothetical protein